MSTREWTDERVRQRRETLRILVKADDAWQGWRCDRSTDCCRFSRTGREPWLTEAEWHLVCEHLSQHGRRPPKPRDDGVCPFLVDDASCAIYEVRPLGCRTFYCARATGNARARAPGLRALVDELEAISNSRGDSRRLTTWLKPEASNRRAGRKPATR